MKGVPVGWFDNFKRNRNAEQQDQQTHPAEEPIKKETETVVDQEEAAASDDSMIDEGFEIDTISVVEREVVEEEVKPIE